MFVFGLMIWLLKYQVRLCLFAVEVFILGLLQSQGYREEGNINIFYSNTF